MAEQLKIPSKTSSDMEEGIKIGAKHGITLEVGRRNKAQGDCLLESVIYSVNDRKCFIEKLNSDVQSYRERWCHEMKNNEVAEKAWCQSDAKVGDWSSGWEKMAQAGEWNVDLYADLMALAVACGSKKVLMIINTQAEFPISVLNPREYGYEPDTGVPVIIFYNGQHYESAVPVTNADVEASVVLAENFISQNDLSKNAEHGKWQKKVAVGSKTKSSGSPIGKAANNSSNLEEKTAAKEDQDVVNTVEFPPNFCPGQKYDERTLICLGKCSHRSAIDWTLPKNHNIRKSSAVTEIAVNPMTIPGLVFGPIENGMKKKRVRKNRVRHAVSSAKKRRERRKKQMKKLAEKATSRIKIQPSQVEQKTEGSCSQNIEVEEKTIPSYPKQRKLKKEPRAWKSKELEDFERFRPTTLEQVNAHGKMQLRDGMKFFGEVAEVS